MYVKEGIGGDVLKSSPNTRVNKSLAVSKFNQ